ncbi:lytic transglycosylase domain-containing protein [Sandaracinobacteroides sp. A072]|uniref:lytic transglycosylase domain-containing protein n=1 Tax=Sandaracinobacteroides sp. A072 TaxID=3461146 RepID=UPI004043266B
MKRLRALALACCALPLAMAATPTLASSGNGAPARPLASPFTAAERAVPAQLSAAQRQQYRQIFAAIEAGRVSAARAALDAMAPGPLHAVAEGQILAAQGPSAGLTRLVAWLEANPDSPQAPAIAAHARKAGATVLPPLARTKRLTPVRLTPGPGPRSARPSSPVDEAFAREARSLIDANTPGEVESLASRLGSGLSAEVRSEWLQRAAWDAYLDLDDRLAKRLGALAAEGASDWAAFGHWVAGLASFRMDDCDTAARHFDAAGQIYVAPADLRSAAAFWAARSHVRCGRPQLSADRLQAAIAREKDGFYGLLAARTLGLEPEFDWREPDFIQADWTTLKGHAGAQRAVALMESGQPGLADRELRHLAAATANETYEPILRLAARLNLPATQYWLAQNPPPGMMPPMSARFPTPDWKPLKGWRVNRSLVFAHALQESKFINRARSGVGAQGLMQIMPGTARDLARALEIEHDEALLADPSFNVEFGQSYLEQLRDSAHTGGLLPKVVAAYNAGPGSVRNWNNGGLKDNGDVLLFIESIPFRETRHYVEVVLRNYWLYELKQEAALGRPTPGSRSIAMVAAGQWPRFPEAD